MPTDPDPDTIAEVFFPAQCACGHLFLERYQFSPPNEKGEVGFCWCGFCRTKRMVKPDNTFAIAEVRRRLAAGEPLREIEDRLDYRENQKREVVCKSSLIAKGECGETSMDRRPKGGS